MENWCPLWFGLKTSPNQPNTLNLASVRKLDNKCYAKKCFALMDLNVHFSGDKKLAVENAEVFELVEIPLCRERPGRERGSRCEFAGEGEGGTAQTEPAPLPPPTPLAPPPLSSNGPKPPLCLPTHLPTHRNGGLENPARILHKFKDV